MALRLKSERLAVALEHWFSAGGVQSGSVSITCSLLETQTLSPLPTWTESETPRGGDGGGASICGEPPSTPGFEHQWPIKVCVIQTLPANL